MPDEKSASKPGEDPRAGQLASGSAGARLRAEPDAGLFGRLAVALEFVTPDQLADAIDLQRRIAQGGRALPLGKIMLAKGYLTAFQIEEVLHAQSRRAVRCASCGAEFAIGEIVKPGSGPVRCPQCLRRLSDASASAAGERADVATQKADREVGREEEKAEGESAAADRAAPASSEQRQPTTTPPLLDATQEVLGVPPPPTPGISLDVRTKDGEFREVDLEPGMSIPIGRAPGIDGIELLDASLSRKHCVIADADGQVTIEDMGSRNGTFVNGERVVRAVLKPGDEIEIGDCRILVRSPRSRRPSVGNTTDIMRAEGLCSLCGVVVSAEEIASGAAQRATGGLICSRCLEVALVPGRMLGGYRIIEQIGHGGMAEVYRAEEVRSGRIVALKALIDAQSASPRARKRFVQEARAGARLEHPNLVRIYDSGEDSGIPYIVMEYIEGQDLSTLLDKRGFLPVAQALDITLDIASVLAFAHSRGVIHRDVKPANIILDRVWGRARLLDLGVAKLIDREQEEGLTRAGMGLGTLEYIAPEQIQSAKDVDARADVFSLAATLYRMVVGKRPFKAQHELALAKSILYQPLGWPAEATSRIPEELCKVVSKAMEKNREKRYASAGEFREALVRVRESLT